MSEGGHEGVSPDQIVPKERKLSPEARASLEQELKDWTNPQTGLKLRRDEVYGIVNGITTDPREQFKVEQKKFDNNKAILDELDKGRTSTIPQSNQDAERRLPAKYSHDRNHQPYEQLVPSPKTTNIIRVGSYTYKPQLPESDGKTAEEQGGKHILPEEIRTKAEELGRQHRERVQNKAAAPDTSNIIPFPTPKSVESKPQSQPMSPIEEKGVG